MRGTKIAIISLVVFLHTMLIYSSVLPHKPTLPNQMSTTVQLIDEVKNASTGMPAQVAPPIRPHPTSPASSPKNKAGPDSNASTEKTLSANKTASTPKEDSDKANSTVSSNANPAFHSNDPPVAAVHPSQIATGDTSSKAGEAKPQNREASCAGVAKPTYPRQSKERGEEGSVTLQLTITAEGRVRDARILKSSGYERLDYAVTQALSTWRCSAAVKEGNTVMERTTLDIHFSLKDAN